jgi:hypothetical protein
MGGGRIRKVGLVGLFALLAALVAGAIPAQAQIQAIRRGPGQTTEELSSEPLAAEVFVPCALGGLGEVVQLSGTQRYRLRTTNYASGAFRVDLRAEYSGVVGVGMISGEPYRATSSTRLIQAGTLPYPLKIVSRSKLALRGLISRTKFRTYETSHVTIDTTGVQTSTSIGPLVDCRTRNQADYHED